MIKVKLIVLLFCVNFCLCQSKYCEICTNHTLCKYPAPGPSIACIGYDRNTLFSNDNINDIVNKINERRNFIAMGHSRNLPGAANMNKVVWSTELATFAQRWVDQCDPSLRPDQEDQCRDLAHGSVGQSIASILNPSLGFNIKSFVEMWFMQSWNYAGSVSHYNQRKDNGSHYFTQLIWAETDSVGCGRASFYVNNAIVDRLVCNFSPKGNVHGKPVFAIGFPATQCQNGKIPDNKFSGLCFSGYEHRANSAIPPVSSLLRILNLSNDSVKQDIDPIYYNMKQINQHSNEMANPRHQMMRHVNKNNAHAVRTNIPFDEEGPFQYNLVNRTRFHQEHAHGHAKGHSHVHHSYEHKEHSTKIDPMEDYRKYDPTISSHNFNTKQNFRKNNLNKQCTRSKHLENNNCGSTSISYNNQCTRGYIKNGILSTHPAFITSYTPNVLQDSCQCSTHSTTCPPSHGQCPYDIHCECVNINNPIMRCPSFLRTIEPNFGSPNIDFHSFGNTPKKILPYEDATYPYPKYDSEWLHNRRRKSRTYDSKSIRIAGSGRQKRESKEITSLKPFWQIDDYSNNRNPQLKSIRYTTLANKKHRKHQRPISKSSTTESITMKLKSSKKFGVTEKYLSFDELLHLRKSSIDEYAARRNIEPAILRNDTEASTAGEISVEYTANTPFIRLKHCTRKLTCTWTVASLTDSGGRLIPGNNGKGGSRTPPGYVDGCTRTSTCTRDYMDRNKFSTLTTESPATEEPQDDSDYCERRSLNIEKRNVDENKLSSNIDDSDKIIFLNGKQLLESNFKVIDTKENDRILKVGSFRQSFFKFNRYAKNNSCRNHISYSDLYYLVIRKILHKWERNKQNNHNRGCPCNNAVKNQFLGCVLVFIIFIFCY